MSLRQAHDTPLGAEHEHIAAVGFQAEVFQQGVIVARAFQQAAQQGDIPLERFVAVAAAFLVAPMGGHAVLGEGVHLARADLNFHRLAFGADDHGMQRFVAVGLRVGDIVVEFLGDMLPMAVHHTQHGVAVADAFHDDAHGAQVVEFVHGDVLALHLFPDAVDVLGTAVDFGRDALADQQAVQLFREVLHVASRALRVSANWRARSPYSSGCR